MRAQSVGTYVKTKEEELRVLVEESEGGQDIPAVMIYLSVEGGIRRGSWRVRATYNQLTIHILER
jgi:hypothetical protein